MKPCCQCGEALGNGAKVCGKCGSKQKEMRVKPFITSNTQPNTKFSQKEDLLLALFELLIWLIPIILGIIGYHYFGFSGIIMGVLLGMIVPWIAAGIFS